MVQSAGRAAGSAGIIVIGDEILSGKTRDENAAFLIAELRELGVSLQAIAVIPDVIDEIAATVRAFSQRYQHVFTSGGVGPTHDDLTMEGVARAFGTRVSRHPQLEGLLRRFYGERLEERNLRMAEVPEGVTLVQPEGLPWPVPCVDNVYILPGIPEIFRRKFAAIRERFRAAPFHLACVFTRDEEGTIAGHLDAVTAAFPSVAVGSYPLMVPDAQRGWRVKVTLESKDAAAVERATAQLVERLGAASIVDVTRA
jgi:molybdenum cofactor synthesis domain-containing protein